MPPSHHGEEGATQVDPNGCLLRQCAVLQEVGQEWRTFGASSKHVRSSGEAEPLHREGVWWAPQRARGVCGQLQMPCSLTNCASMRRALRDHGTQVLATEWSPILKIHYKEGMLRMLIESQIQICLTLSSDKVLITFKEAYFLREQL